MYLNYFVENPKVFVQFVERIIDANALTAFIQSTLDYCSTYKHKTYFIEQEKNTLPIITLCKAQLLKSNLVPILSLLRDESFLLAKTHWESLLDLTAPIWQRYALELLGPYLHNHSFPVDLIPKVMGLFLQNVSANCMDTEFFWLLILNNAAYLQVLLESDQSIHFSDMYQAIPNDKLKYLFIFEAICVSGGIPDILLQRFLACNDPSILVDLVEKYAQQLTENNLICLIESDLSESMSAPWYNALLALPLSQNNLSILKAVVNNIAKNSSLFETMLPILQQHMDFISNPWFLRKLVANQIESQLIIEHIRQMGESNIPIPEQDFSFFQRWLQNLMRSNNESSLRDFFAPVILRSNSKLLDYLSQPLFIADLLEQSYLNDVVIDWLVQNPVTTLAQKMDIIQRGHVTSAILATILDQIFQLPLATQNSAEYAWQLQALQIIVSHPAMTEQMILKNAFKI